MYQDVGTFRHLNQVGVMRTGVAREHHGAIISIESEPECREHLMMVHQRCLNGDTDAVILVYCERVHRRARRFIGISDFERQLDVADFVAFREIRRAIVSREIIDGLCEGFKQVVRHLHSARRGIFPSTTGTLPL